MILGVSNKEVYYDVYKDFGLIESAFLHQYHIRLRQELKDMSAEEFLTYLAGMKAEERLHEVIAIRSETDYEKIRKFSKYEREIYDEWNRDKIKKISDEEGDKAVEMITAMIKRMAKE